MTTPRLPSARLFVPAPAALLGLAALLVLSGCGEEEPIVTQTVPKPHVVNRLGNEAVGASGGASSAKAPEATHRTIVAMVPHGGQSWFFKVLGPIDRVTAHEDEILALVKSVRFPDDPEGKPTWTLPEGWKELPPSPLRQATLRIEDGDPPLELAVSSFPTTLEDYDEYILINANRWRRELGLPPVTRSQLADRMPSGTMTRFEQGGETVTLFGFVGSQQQGGGAPPMLSGGRSSPAPKPSAGGAQTLSFDRPQGWAEAQNDTFSRYAFSIGEGDEAARVTVTPGGGDLAANINRWRQQLGLAPWSPNEMAEGLKEISVDGERGVVVSFAAEGDDAARQALTGAIVVSEGRAWFFKLTGTAGVVGREREHFDSFLQSVRFE